MGRFIVGLAVLAFVATSGGPVNAEARLTGVNVFGTDASGNFVGEHFNTRGGDSQFNLYLHDGAHWVNGGNSTSTTDIDIPLTSGIYTYDIYGEPWAIPTYFSLGLFFNDETFYAGISAYAATDYSPSPPYPEFYANSSLKAHPLWPTGGLAPAAGTLTFTDGITTATLTDFYWSSPSVNSVNLVDAFNNTSGGYDDLVGKFTLEVSVVPEPSTLVMLSGLAALGITFGWYKRRK